MQTDLCNRIMNTQRKVDNLGQNVQSWGAVPTGATDGDITKILCQLREYQDEIKYQTTQVDALATRVLDWKAAWRTLPQSSLRWKSE